MCIFADMPNSIVEGLQPVLAAGKVFLDTPKTAELVVNARKSLNVSQKAMAIEMEISQGYLCDLEKGTRNWSIELFNRAKEALGRMAA